MDTKELVLCIVFLLSTTAAAQICKKINSCKCKMEDSGKMINLRSLAHPGNLPKWTLSGGDGWMYKYNPCIGYALGTYSDLAVGQAATAGTVFDLGVQSNAEFNETDDGRVAIKYAAKNNLRSTTVILKCDPNSMYDRLDFMGEVRITEYEMILTSACACPGYCDDLGLYDDVARNISGYREDRYYDKRPGEKYGNSRTSERDSAIPWSEISASTLVLVLHDVALVVIVLACLLAVRYCKVGRRYALVQRKHACKYCDSRYADRVENGKQLQCAKRVNSTSYKVTSEIVRCQNCTCDKQSHQKFLTSHG